MIVQKDPDVHLTYCMNIHPGESWEEQFDAVKQKALLVKAKVAPDQPFGLGLRLSARAAQTLAGPAELEAFSSYLAENGLYVFTINGFPYGQFHGGAIKEKVYQPDWRTTSRRDYTNRLGEVLAALLPEGVAGSISTVPCSFKPWIIRPGDVARMTQSLMDCVLHLDQLRERQGKEIHLGLEPEPGCYLESTGEFIAFFNDHLLPEGMTYLKRRRGCGPGEAEALIRRHLGICLDTCHLALQYEDLCASLKRIREEGIRISKVQLSAALEAFNERSRLEALHPFVESVYLHQVKARTRHGAFRSWNDLPDALRVIKESSEIEVLRVHYHVPLFWQGSSLLDTTASNLTPAFMKELAAGSAGEHLEIETYTYEVLPPELRSGDVVESIVREYEWTRDRLTP